MAPTSIERQHHNHSNRTLLYTIVVVTLGLISSDYYRPTTIKIHAFQFHSTIATTRGWNIASSSAQHTPPKRSRVTTIFSSRNVLNDNISFAERDDDVPSSSSRGRNGSAHQRQRQGQKQQQGRPRQRRREGAAFDPWEMEIVPRVSCVRDDNSYGEECRLDDPKLKACFPFVGMLRDSANYIANHRHTTAVYHIPGELLDWEGFPALMDDIALTWLLGMRVVIVAGCRHQINARLANEKEDDDGKDNNESSSPSSQSSSISSSSSPPSSSSSSSSKNNIMPNSLRVTSLQTMRIVAEEAGYVRFEIERLLNRCLRLHGGANLRVPGALNSNVVSGNFVLAEPIGVVIDDYHHHSHSDDDSDDHEDGVDFQFTGVPSTVEVDKIRAVHDRGDIVLLTPISASPSGELMNVRSESLAAHVAASMKADKIVYCSNDCMVLRNRKNGRTVQNFRSGDARDVLQRWGVWMDGNFLPWIDPRGGAGAGADAGAGAGDEGEGESGELGREAMEYLLQIGWANLALERGVARAHIVAPSDGALLTELFTAKDGSGTCISQDEVEEIHPDENFYGHDDDHDTRFDDRGRLSEGLRRTAPFS